MHDALHSPGHFNTVYVYEREQRWPWGHRNIVFAHRGGPSSTSNALSTLNHPAKDLPVETNASAEISPYELWDLLKNTVNPWLPSVILGQPAWARIGKSTRSSIFSVVELYQGPVS